MAFLSAPSILQTKDAADVIIVPVNRALRFVGAAVTPDGPGQSLITIGAGSGTWTTAGNVLTGGTPSTPAQFFGSNNDFDIIEKRNGTESLRLAAQGLNLNVLAYQFIYASTSFRYGALVGGGTITASGIGSMAFGDTNASIITASGDGALAHGHTLTAGATVLAGGIGSQAFGFAENGGAITTAGNGALALGFAQNGAAINSSGRGSIAFGTATGTGATIRALDLGAFAGGAAVATNSTILAQNSGCFAFGYVEDSCEINANPGAGSFGAMAVGYAQNSIGFALIIANASGSFARGYANSKIIQATAIGAHASGAAVAGNIIAGGIASMAHGDTVTASAAYSVAFGLGNNNSSYACLLIGRFGITTGSTPAAWVATDPVLLIGNGTGIGTEATAYEIDKDGRQITTASHVDRGIRIVVAAGAISARTDYTVICDTTGATGNLTLPAGEDGLEFVFTSKGAGAAIYTLVTGDAFDVSVVTAIATGVVSRIKFFSGTWYAV